MDNFQEPEPTQDRQTFPYSLILLGYLGYYLVEGALKLLFRHLKPDFYSQLKKEERFLPFFGFCMGWLITLVSTPICWSAYKSGTSELTTQAQICIASRSILWASELNRLEYLSVFVKHHTFSLAHLIWHLRSGAPLRPLFMIYASLATELLSTAAAILTICGRKSFNSPVARAIQVANTVAVPIIRVPPVVYTAVWYLGELDGWQRVLGASWLALYLASFTYSTVKGARRLEIGFSTLLESFKTLAQWTGISTFGALVAVAYLATVRSTLAIYNFSTNTQGEISQIQSGIMALLIQSTLAGFLGARLPSLLSDNTIRRTLFSRTGYWLQSGTLAAASTLLLSPAGNVTVDARLCLLASGAVSLLLGEAIGRLGCHSAGCCGSSRARSTKAQAKSKVTKRQYIISAPLMASVLCLIAYTGTMRLLLKGSLDVYSAGAAAMALQGLSRLVAETLRSDVKSSISIGGLRIRPTVLFACAEVISGLALLLSLSHLYDASSIVRSGRVVSMGSHSSPFLSMSGFIGGLVSACGDSGSEALSPFLAMSGFIGGLTKACSDGGSEAVDSVSLGATALAFAGPVSLAAAPMLFTRKCADGGAQR